MSNETFSHPFLVDRDGEQIEVMVEIVVGSWGVAASGFHGRPEDYDPGCGADAWVASPMVKGDGGQTITLTDDEQEQALEAFLDDPPEPDEPDWDHRAEMAREDREYDRAHPMSDDW